MGVRGELIDLKGTEFGMWKVISRTENKGKRVMWLCKCKCGTEKIVQGTSLKNNVSTNCGCSKNHYKTHGMADTRLYGVWQRMKGCTSSLTHQDYCHYGNRGISMCDEWKYNFINFYTWAIDNGYKKGLEIDRINNDGNYEPSNCRWVTRKINVLNRRNTVMIELNGITKPLKIWCEEFNLSYNTVYNRIFRYKWDNYRALEVYKV